MGNLQMGSNNNLCWAALLLVIIILQAATCAQVNYIPSASCASPAGCSFNSPIWDSPTPPTSSDDVFITSDVPITIFVDGDDVSISSLTISQNVNLHFFNWSTVSIGSEQDTVSFTFDGPNCSLLIECSSVSVIGAQGTALEIHNSTFTATIGSIAMETVVTWFSDINANFDIYFKTLRTHSSIVNASSVQTQHVFANDTLFETKQLQVGNATISNSILILPDLLFLPHGTLQITDCETSIETLTISSHSVLIFTTSFPSSSHNNAFINTISYDFTLKNFELHLGDNMNFTLASGPIYTLYLGAQVTMNFQDNWVSIYNLVQNSEDFATISTSGYFQFHNEVSFYGSINLLPNGLFNVNSTVTITPQNGPAIFGNGTLQVYQELICPGQLIEVGKVLMYSGIITAASLTTPSMVVEKSSQATVHGNVSVSSSINLHGTLAVNGSFSQVGGSQNYTVNAEYVSADTAYLLVYGDMNISSPEISAFVVGETEDTRWLLVRSTNDPLSLSFGSSFMGSSLTISRRGGEVYLELKPQGFWARNYVYMIISLSVIVAVLAGVGINCYQRRRARRKHYKELREVY